MPSEERRSVRRCIKSVVSHERDYGEQVAAEQRTFAELGLGAVPCACYLRAKQGRLFLAARRALCGLGCAAPNAWLLTQAVCPKELVGTASGLQNLGGNIAGILVPVLTGFIAHRTGQSSWAFSLAGLILLGGIAGYWFLIPENSRIGSINAREKERGDT